MTTATGVQGPRATGPPSMLSWLKIVRIIILALSLAATVAGGCLISLYNRPKEEVYFRGSAGPGGFIVLDAALTWIVLGTMIISEYWAPQIYMRTIFVGILGLDVILWAAAWGWAASASASFYNRYEMWNFDKIK